MTSDRNSQAVQFVKPYLVHGPAYTVGQDHSRVDKLCLGLLELAQDRGRANFHRWHGLPGHKVD